jgi:hypothetical protein
MSECSSLTLMHGNAVNVHLALGGSEDFHRRAQSGIVFPAPFGPRNPTHFCTFKFRFETPENDPYLIGTSIVSTYGPVKKDSLLPIRSEIVGRYAASSELRANSMQTRQWLHQSQSS